MHLREWFQHLFTPTSQALDRIEKAEKFQQEIQDDLKDIQHRIDPLKKLLIDMEHEFKKHDHFNDK
jgi:hypothetical protein